MSVRKRAAARAYEKGYQVTEEGKVKGPFGFRKLVPGRNGYLKFNIRSCGNVLVVPVHYLSAYQNYGDSFLETTLEVRHLDGNYLNNSPSNISLGTKSQNMRDKDPSVRLRAAQQAASRLRKLSEDQVKELRLKRKNGSSYAELSEEYKIAKSTISYIVRNKTYKGS